ncbi:UNVERIFIED_CONTAM: Retrovirus-related Pol polyprotein from transposon [Sesamum latifolium]|uniref:Retrovirus-related Pol polyprotein from transposon n=1 Tax=Sesamum latifolium TaxID=2727402 RepID=A0AAW2XCG8_9LAMI
MNDLFRPLLRCFVLVFFENILVYSNSGVSLFCHLSQVLQLLQDNKFYAKLSKCTFGVPSIEYLGHVISTASVAADQSKLLAISNWSPPKSLTTLRAFLGLIGFYRKFICRYASIADPLIDLLKNRIFCWTPVAAIAFDTLKRSMISFPIFRLPDFSQPFDVTMDTSQVAIGAILSQQCQPIAFFSKKLSGRMQSLSTYDREMFAISETI